VLHKLITCDPVAMWMTLFFLGMLVVFAIATCISAGREIAGACKSVGLKKK